MESKAAWIREIGSSTLGRAYCCAQLFAAVRFCGNVAIASFRTLDFAKFKTELRISKTPSDVVAPNSFNQSEPLFKFPSHLFYFERYNCFTIQVASRLKLCIIESMTFPKNRIRTSRNSLKQKALLLAVWRFGGLAVWRIIIWRKVNNRHEDIHLLSGLMRQNFRI
jgi:hypothetical protein